VIGISEGLSRYRVGIHKILSRITNGSLVPSRAGHLSFRTHLSAIHSLWIEKVLSL